MDQKLKSMGWCVLRFWSKDALKKTDECVRDIEEVILSNLFEEQ